MYGIKFSDLTEDRLKEILLLYEEITGGNMHLSSATMRERLEWLKEGLSKTNAVDWRYGSMLIKESGLQDEDAKLVIWHERTIWNNDEKDMIIRFAFDPNLVSGQKAETIKKEFREAIDNLLLKWKVNIKI